MDHKRVNATANYLSGLELGAMVMKMAMEALTNLTDNTEEHAEHMLGVIDYVSVVGVMIDIIIKDQDTRKTAKTTSKTTALSIRVASGDEEWMRQIRKARALRRALEAMQRNELKRDENTYDLYQKRYGDALGYVLNLLKDAAIESAIR